MMQLLQSIILKLISKTVNSFLRFGKRSLDQDSFSIFPKTKESVLNDLSERLVENVEQIYRLLQKDEITQRIREKLFAIREQHYIE